MPERNRAEFTKLFESLSQFDPLLPPSLERRRASLPVVDSLMVKSIPGEQEMNTLKDKNEYDGLEFQQFQEIVERDGIGHLFTDTQEQFVLMRKLFPHAEHELMLISSSEEVKRKLGDFTEATQGKLFTVISQFISFSKQRGLYPYVAYNFTPTQNDRVLGQSEERFHIHCIARTPEELSYITQYTQSLGEIKPIRQRRLIDEASILAGMFIRDYCEHFCPFETLNVFESNDLLPGSVLKICGGWETLSTEAFHKDMKKLHQLMASFYKEWIDKGVVKIKEPWQREQFLDLVTEQRKSELEKQLSDLGWISTQSKETFLHMLNKLNQRALFKESLFRDPAAKDVVIYSYPIGDLCYTVSFSEVDGQAVLLVRLQVFTDLGGAGLQYINGVITKTKRGVGVFNQEELLARREFENSFAESIATTKPDKDEQTIQSAAIRKVDTYLRRNDTLLAKSLKSISAKKGAVYQHSVQKKVSELATTLLVAIPAMPVVAILGILAKLEDDGPMFYRHPRVDKKGEFKLWKIRTMIEGAEKLEKQTNAETLDPAKDPRNTRLGNILREYEIEETPQLYQVLLGRLRLVGLRASSLRALSIIKQNRPQDYDMWQKAYQSDRSSLFSLNSALQRQKSRKNPARRIHADIFYSKNASLGLDLYIIARNMLNILDKLLTTLQKKSK